MSDNILYQSILGFHKPDFVNLTMVKTTKIMVGISLVPMNILDTGLNTSYAILITGPVI